MAKKNRYGGKKRKSAKRVRAGKKAWRTRKRNAAKKGGTHRVRGKAYKNPKRVRAGKKAWRTKVRRYGSKKAALAHSFGHRGRKSKKRGRKGVKRGRK